MRIFREKLESGISGNKTAAFMADISPLDSSLPWLWILEYLSTFQQVDTNILHGLVERIPDLPDEQTKNTRERVSLRCLEQLFGRVVGLASDVTASRVCFDHSQSCEDVLQQILEETSVSELKSTRPELLKWDLRPFIGHKRATLPKSALEEFKDTIHSSSHPYAVALREISGLALNKEHDGAPVGDGNHDTLRLRRLEGSSDAQTVPEERYAISPKLKKFNKMFQHELCKRNGLPSKMRGCKLASDDDVSQDGLLDSNDFHPNAKRLKLSLDQISNPPVLKDASEGVGGDNGDGSRALLNESRAGELCQDDHIENAHVDKKCEDVAGDGPVQFVMVKETPNCAVTSLSRKPLMEARQKVSVDEANEKGGQTPALGTTDSAADEMQQNSNPREVRFDHPFEDKTIQNDDNFEKEWENIAITKSQFLSSQCTLSQDPLDTDGWTEQNLCVKCNKEGQVLACTASGCALVVHESCLGSPARFDENGNFHCPFCTYSLIISKHLEVKKRLFEARKQLSAFIRPVEHSSKEPAEGHGHQRENDQIPPSRNGKGVNHQLQIGVVDKQLSGPSTSTPFCDVNVANVQRNQENEPLREKEQLPRSSDDKQQFGPSLPCGAEDETSELRSQKNGQSRGKEQDPTCQNAEDVNCNFQRNLINKQQSGPSLSGKNVNTPGMEGEPNVMDKTVCVPISENKGKEKVVRIEAENDNSNSSSYNLGPAPINGQEAEGVNIEEVLRKRVTDAAQQAHVYNFDGEGSTDASDDKFVISQYCTRPRKRDEKHSYDLQNPQKRRNKVAWTTEEEEMLIEGVRKFPKRDGVMRWTEILDFGASVFKPCRTSRDLKDKWRNLCR